MRRTTEAIHSLRPGRMCGVHKVHGHIAVCIHPNRESVRLAILYLSDIYPFQRETMLHREPNRVKPLMRRGTERA
jgi:hypothetical protein